MTVPASTTPYSLSLQFTLSAEGMYSHDAGDPGGQTFCGICMRDDSEWSGWPLVQKALASGSNPNTLYPVLASSISDFYKKYWAYNNCEAISLIHPALAVLVFDMNVNDGAGGSAIIVQRIIGANPDGQLGPISLKLLASYLRGNGLVVLNESINAVCKAHYDSIVLQYPSMKKFLQGWYNRIMNRQLFIQSHFSGVAAVPSYKV